MNPVDAIFRLFAIAGLSAYYGEAVSEAEHALQAAHKALTARAEPSLIAAALLHDVGHLLHGLPENIAHQGIDARHEVGGAEWLARHHFNPAVTEPVRLHVAAKRYLCAVEPGYLEGLSPASQLSLKLQGGAFDAEGKVAFERSPYFAGAVAVRRWDDDAKAPGLVVPDLEHYRDLLEMVLSSNPA